jgi:hypothetical protein
MINYTEAQDEARFLTKQSGREVVAKTVDCDCASTRCATCGGQGYVFELRFKFCNHAVTDDDSACVEDFCREREAASVFPMEAPKLPLHKPIAEEDREVA